MNLFSHSPQAFLVAKWAGCTPQTLNPEHICPAGVLLDFPLPLALYKKVARQPLTLRDLEGFDPTLGRSLRQLLDYNGAVA